MQKHLKAKAKKPSTELLEEITQIVIDQQRAFSIIALLSIWGLCPKIEPLKAKK